MSIIWICTDDTDFYKLPDHTSIWTVDSRIAYSRSAHQSSDYDRAYFFSPRFDSVTSAWLSLIYIADSTSNQFESTNVPIFSFYNIAAKYRIGLGMGSSSYKAAIVKYDSGGFSVLAQEDCTSLRYKTPYRAAYTKFDIQLSNYGEFGTVNAFLNGELLISYTGDIRLSGVSGFDSICIGPWATGFAAFHLSEFIVADEDTRKLAVKTLVPDAAGDVNEWLGAYTAIDEAVLSTTDKITADVDDQLFLTHMTGMPSLSRSHKVKTVRVAAYLDPAYSGLGVQIGIKTNNAIHLGDVEEHGKRITIEKIYHDNPETETEFTPAEVDSLQLALFSVSTFTATTTT